MLACDSMLPVPVTIAAARENASVHAGVVTGATRISPGASRSSSSTVEITDEHKAGAVAAFAFHSNVGRTGYAMRTSPSMAQEPTTARD